MQGRQVTLPIGKNIQCGCGKGLPADRHGPGAGLPCRINDRSIAGTATQIAGQVLIDLCAAGKMVCFVLSQRQLESGDRHDEPRSAEAALGGVLVGHRPLDRIGTGLGKMLDCNDLSAIDHTE